MKTIKDIIILMDKKSKSNDFKNCKTSDFTRDLHSTDIVILKDKSNQNKHDLNEK